MFVSLTGALGREYCVLVRTGIIILQVVFEDLKGNRDTKEHGSIWPTPWGLAHFFFNSHHIRPFMNLPTKFPIIGNGYRILDMACL